MSDATSKVMQECISILSKIYQNKNCIPRTEKQIKRELLESAGSLMADWRELFPKDFSKPVIKDFETMIAMKLSKLRSSKVVNKNLDLVLANDSGTITIKRPVRYTYRAGRVAEYTSENNDEK